MTQAIDEAWRGGECKSVVRNNTATSERDGTSGSFSSLIFDGGFGIPAVADV